MIPPNAQLRKYLLEYGSIFPRGGLRSNAVAMSSGFSFRDQRSINILFRR